MRPPDDTRRHELRTAAAKLFREVGYSRATVRDIAKAVGLQSGSIFYHYETKEDILVDVMLEGMRRFTAVAQTPLPPTATARDRLRMLFIGHLNALHSGDGDEVAVVLSEWRSLSAKSRRKVVKQRDEVDAMWDDALQAAKGEGFVDADLRLLRLAMLGAMNWSLQWYDKGGALSIEALADSLLAIFVPPARS